MHGCSCRRCGSPQHRRRHHHIIIIIIIITILVIIITIIVIIVIIVFIMFVVTRDKIMERCPSKAGQGTQHLFWRFLACKPCACPAHGYPPTLNPKP